MQPEEKSYRFEGLWRFMWLAMLVAWGAELALTVLHSPASNLSTRVGWWVLIGLVAVGLYCQDYRKKAHKQGTLCTTGPYGVVRHPIYHFFILSGVCMLAMNMNSIPLWFACTGTIVAGVATCFLEEGVVRAEWGSEADRYYARTPRFLYEWLWFRR